jgi:DNA-directed RNA polymerase specialized sigma24 family protein
MTPSHPSAFPPTRLSVIERLRTDDAEVRRQAFGEIVTGYWRPVYAHLRLTLRLAPEDAEDATQSFFTSAFEKAWLETYDPARARFRTFVRVCADRLVANRRQAESRAKRGGGAHVVSLDFPMFERELHDRAGRSPSDPDELFRQEFVRSVFVLALDGVRADCDARGRSSWFTLFERYDLDPAEGVSYASLAREYDLSVTQVTNRLSEVRRAFRQRALDVLRTLSGSHDHFRSEAREIFGLEVE